MTLTNRGDSTDWLLHGSGMTKTQAHTPATPNVSLTRTTIRESGLSEARFLIVSQDHSNVYIYIIIYYVICTHSSCFFYCCSYIHHPSPSFHPSTPSHLPFFRTADVPVSRPGQWIQRPEVPYPRLSASKSATGRIPMCGLWG